MSSLPASCSVFWSSSRTINSPFGEVLKSIRENEQRAISLGYKTDQYKLLAYILSGTLAGFAGSLKVFVAQNASLTDVHWSMSGEIVLMTLVGGLGTVFGPVVGAFRDHRHAAIFGGVRAVGDRDPGRDFRCVRADVPTRRDRRNRALFPALALTRGMPPDAACPCIRASGEPSTKRWMIPSGIRSPRAFQAKWFMTTV